MDYFIYFLSYAFCFITTIVLTIIFLYRDKIKVWLDYPLGSIVLIQVIEKDRDERLDGFFGKIDDISGWKNSNILISVEIPKNSNYTHYALGMSKDNLIKIDKCPNCGPVLDLCSCMLKSNIQMDNLK